MNVNLFTFDTRDTLCCWYTLASGLIFFFFPSAAVYAEEFVNSDARVEFFESKIRPLLVNRCYECHSGEAQSLKAGLRLDSRAGVFKGGDSGPVVIPGEPDDSLLIRAVRYESNEMPPDQKLSNSEITALVKWVEWGAPWPSEPAATRHTDEKGYDWEQAGNHWAFQPIRKLEPPAADAGARIQNAIDRFVTSKTQEKGATATTTRDGIGLCTPRVHRSDWPASDAG